jgi:hypothetical protein
MVCIMMSSMVTVFGSFLFLVYSLQSAVLCSCSNYSIFKTGRERENKYRRGRGKRDLEEKVINFQSFKKRSTL